VTLVALLGSAAYLVANKQLSAEVAAWIFFSTNALAVMSLMLLSLPAVRDFRRRYPQVRTD
jgi:ABC-type transport system involved in cytochrome c biogenesis permease subunit